MKTATNAIKYIFIIFLIFSCIGQRPSGNREALSSSSTETLNDPTFTTAEKLYWYSDAISYNAAVKIFSDTNKNLLLRGKIIHKFIQSDVEKETSDNEYCLVFSYDDVNSKNTLRIKAIKQNEDNSTKKTREYYFKLDFQNAINQTQCSGNLTNANTIDASFTPSDLCPSCSEIITSDKISIYKIDEDKIDDKTIVLSSSLDLAALSLEVSSPDADPNTSDCSDSTCQASGDYDCCSDKGVCVKDATEKINANLQSEYPQAKADVLLNPINFIKYPSVFNVCLNVPHTIPTTPTSGDGEAEAIKKYNQLKDDYYCLQNGVSNPPDYSRCDLSPTFITPGIKTDYDYVRESVWKRCGCTATSNQLDSCPDLTLKAIFKTSTDTTESNIKEIQCFAPEENPTTSDQKLEIEVSSRSAPHRFFKASNGNSVDNISNITGSNETQEGLEFSYQDFADKTIPQNNTFNMNAILGQMSLELNQALPAKAVNISQSKTYVIMATSGSYVPCVLCSSDFWNPATYPFIKSVMGKGIQSVGYKTNRTDNNQNYTGANYGDTNFGRSCWVPPTMIPFSHKQYTTTPEQRLSRLQTQAVFYANGYKKDWYGFNQGALIGSFDGVRWFAVGTGRRVTATSNKLFLAINAPFADLSSNSTFNVSITEDNNSTIVANSDYNPSLSLTHPQQNDAATCQANHQCSTDSDCITRLGWEYSCLDISTYKSVIPKFDIDGNEIANSQVNNATFTSPDQILASYVSGETSKRCVYRGAGSLCKMRFDLNLNSNSQKAFTCAPNFYCASLSSLSFNSGIVRTPTEVENAQVQYGQDANVLGRPIRYAGAIDGIPQAVIDNIKESAKQNSENNDADFGICRPGKRLNLNNYLQQHQSKDNALRTDYISQISSCDSSATGDARVKTCPILGTDSTDDATYNNYIFSVTDPANYDAYHQQNACGKETQNASFISAFNEIESDPLSSLASIFEPTLARDACTRRAGAICHTNLDCSPNNLHEENVDLSALTFYGNTLAEQKYWSESLVCGQATPKPVKSSTNYSSYDLTKNRCCREVGKTITMYTEGNSTLIPGYETENMSLEVNRLTKDDPTADGRYSRYTIVAPLGIKTTTPYNEIPKVETNITPKQYQWRTINETGKKTCCGGGWVRKFSSGSNNWALSSSKLSINYTNFRCLNYDSKLINYSDSVKEGNVNKVQYRAERDKLCLSPADGGCIQRDIPGATNFDIKYPTNNGADLPGPTTATISTSPIYDTDDSSFSKKVNKDAPYQPIHYPFNNAALASGPYNTNSTGTQNHFNIFNKVTSFYIPIYVGGIDNIVSVEFEFYDSTGATVDPFSGAAATRILVCPNQTSPIGLAVLPDTSIGNNKYCIADLPSGLVLHAASQEGPIAWSQGGVKITYKVPGTPGFDTPSGTPIQINDDNRGMNAGNSIYYLTKLSRLELTGVPQIFYEPIYCNTDKSLLVEGIFSNATTRTNFETTTGPLAYSFTYDNNMNGTNKSLGKIYDENTNSGINTGDDVSNPAENIVFQDKLQVEQIFESNEFLCCTRLGEEVTQASNCCSGYSETVNEKSICRLPTRTDLSVYFNRFISGEGTIEDEPDIGLEDEDFIPETGEPKLTVAVSNKISALGKKYCQGTDGTDSAIRTGGAFGNFFGEVNNGTYQQSGSIDDSRKFGIVDSPSDADDTGTNGKVAFEAGFKWNHHIYCK